MDMVEDFVEKAHQEGKKLDHLVARMCSQSFRQQELAKIRRKWLEKDPDVLVQIDKVQTSSKRQQCRSCTSEPKRKTNKLELKRSIKQEKRQKKTYGKTSNVKTPI